MKKYLALAMFLVLAVALASPFSVSAKTKAGTKSGSFFYFFDKTFEKANLFFTFNPEKKAKKAFEHAEERLAEAEELANENNKEAVKTAMENYKKNIEVLEKVLIKVPEEAKQAIEKAIEASKERQEEVMKETTEIEKEVSEIKPEIKETENGWKKENEEKAEIKDDKKDEQSKEIEKLKKEVEGLKQKTSQIKVIEKIEKPVVVEKTQSSIGNYSSSSSSAITETYILKIITSIETDDNNAWGEVTNYNKAENTTEIFNSSYKNLCGTYGHNPSYKTKYRSYGNSVCEVYYPVGSVVDLVVGSQGSFKGVSLSGENCSGAQCLVVMNGNKTIYARFNKEIAFIETLSPTRGSIWTTGQTYQVKWETSGIMLDSQGYILLKSITPHDGHYVVEKSVVLNGGSSSNYGGSRNFIVPSASALFPAGYYVIRIGLGRYEDYDEARARSVFFDSVPFEIVTISN